MEGREHDRGEIGGAHTDVVREEDPALGVERVVRCAACGHAIARARDRTTVNGAHVHVFKNPEAIDFRVGCFASASGCAGWGEASAVWTWFPGYAWRTALCARCMSHVGWSFAHEGEAASFHALILDRVIDE